MLSGHVPPWVLSLRMAGTAAGRRPVTRRRACGGCPPARASGRCRRPRPRPGGSPPRGRRRACRSPAGSSAPRWPRPGRGGRPGRRRCRARLDGPQRLGTAGAPGQRARARPRWCRRGRGRRCPRARDRSCGAAPCRPRRAHRPGRRRTAPRCGRRCRPAQARPPAGCGAGPHPLQRHERRDRVGAAVQGLDAVGEAFMPDGPATRGGRPRVAPGRTPRPGLHPGIGAGALVAAPRSAPRWPSSRPRVGGRPPCARPARGRWPCRSRSPSRRPPPARCRPRRRGQARASAAAHSGHVLHHAAEPAHHPVAQQVPTCALAVAAFSSTRRSRSSSAGRAASEPGRTPPAQPGRRR